MTRIAEDAGCVTLINVFTVDPGNQQQLLDILARATDTTVRVMPGFVSAALHRSVDGSKVTMYSQWQTAEHYRKYQELLSNPAAAPYVGEALAIAKFEPAMYEVVKVFTGSSDHAT